MPNFSRRAAVNDIEKKATTNAQLWLDKYFDRRNGEPNQVLVEQAADIVPPEAYGRFYERWREGLEAAGAEMREARTSGRLVVGLGADSVLETSIALNHTYGVPYIPGSALKGLASHFANQHLEPHWKKGGDAHEIMFGTTNSAGYAHEIMFGTTNSAGYVTFFDALFVPKSGKQGKMLWKDVITVHHKEYYQLGEKPPADWDSTTIIPFLTTYGRFLIALAGPEGWVEKAFEILALALEKEGVGAKTSSGYGRLTFDFTVEENNSRNADTYEIDKRRLLEERPPHGKYRGTVKHVNDDGRYAFITPAAGGADDFVHVSQMHGHALREGQVLQYSKGMYNGKPQAQDVEVLLEK